MQMYEYLVTAFALHSTAVAQYEVIELTDAAPRQSVADCHQRHASSPASMDASRLWLSCSELTILL
jgi:hypothetical protein